ncbi:MAG: hypothetical protein HOE72_04095 [Candidatus Marinimicrobia bacterium]|nr:hypothetical protein [Candidatus Neomarinimicrobiota bacterium]MBT4064420.1 hypothetical protein [Candidatus Neomarinimicrobiota bacterium]MBT4737021.1 hypothetical protein [Candidatus Neomarinimicrobiota bacterium]MBT5386717.1 hypothetical protein [Candidatus Neomarinimicrobiota bacterium]MBT5775946.1 hypothetical protein [Candidatus Neomarinimicrobiota bacterium]|tara:strand:+ start:840 stop:1556 length:717 start_codon:yes stop_codon:yes gene_type:complete
MGFLLSIIIGLSVLMPGENNMIQLAGIPFDIIKNGDSDHRYIWVHGDEQTAKMALENHMKTNEGTAFLVTGILREAEFYGGIIDPNRIFSSEGAKANIQKYNRKWSRAKKAETLEMINRDRDSFLEKILPQNGGLLIALHNNYQGYNVKTEIPLSNEISIKKDQNPRDFFICTHRADYDILTQSPFNVVLQETMPKRDDGSLSWAAMRHGVRYVNIETRLGWLSQQKKMLNYLEDHLK